MFAEQREYLRQPTGRTAAAIVVICGLMLSYFVSRTFVEPLPRHYSPDFGIARWIQVSPDERAAYFRKDLFITGRIKRSWLEIAATGSYQLIVNNVAVDQVQLPGARVSGLYDITGLLSTGKNAIAVYVPGSWFDAALQIRARGSFTVAGAGPQEFYSDSNWKATASPRNYPGGLFWSAPAMDDELWPSAQETNGDGPQPAVQQLPVDPRLIESAQAGSWIAPSIVGPDVATFSYDLTLPSRAVDGWLQVAANGAYDVLVNGRVAAMAPYAPQAAPLGQNAALELTGGRMTTYRQLPTIIRPGQGLPGPDIYSAITSMPVNGGSGSSLGQPQSITGSPPASSEGVAGPSLATKAKSVTATGPRSFAPVTQAAISAASVRGIAASLRQIQRIPIAGVYPSQEPFFEISPSIASPSAANPSNLAIPGSPSNAQPSNSSASETQMSAQHLTARGLFTLRQRSLLLPPPSQSSALTPPSVVNFSMPAADAVPQIIPSIQSPGPVPNAALKQIAYNIRDWLRPGRNQIAIRVQAAVTQGPPVLFANGLVDTGTTGSRQFHTDSTWRVESRPTGDLQVRSDPSRVIGAYGDAPWGASLIVVASPLWLPGQDFKVTLHWLIAMTGVTLAVFVIWLVAGPILAAPGDRSEMVWNVDAIFHFVAFVALVGLFVPSYDIRYPYDWCFRSIVILGVVVWLSAGKLFLLLARLAPRRGAANIDRHEPDAVPSRVPWQFILLLAITAVGTIVRASKLTSFPMGHDETIMVLLARNVLKAGYPYIQAGSFTRVLSTYELLPYPIALSMAIFGHNVFAYRLPALIFSGATIALIGYVGHRMMGWRTGILAATIWALLPIPIGWARDGFYPSQECFFALGTFWLFFEAIRGQTLNHRFLALSAVAFILSYLTWEAGGFILPTLIIALLVVKWGDFRWMSDGHLWRWFGVVATIVIVQLCYRQFTLIPDYLGVVKDLSEVTSPSLVVFDRLVFDPFYYLNALFLAENHIALSLVAAFGFLFVRRNPALTYLYVSLAALYVFYTCFLDHYAPRYCFNWLPLLVLAGSGSLFALFDRVETLPVWVSGKWLGRLAFTVAAGILIATSNQYWLNLFRTAPDPSKPVWYDRIHVAFKADYFGANQYVADHFKAGDIVIAGMPHCYYLDTGRWPNYSINTRLQFRMYYDGGAVPVTYIDKWLGVKVIHNLDELVDIHTHGGRLWIIQDVPNPDSAEVFKYLQTNGRVVYESTQQQVFLLENAPSFARSGI